MTHDTTVYINIRDADNRRLIVDGAMDLWCELLATLTHPAEPTPVQPPDTTTNAQEFTDANASK